MAVTTGPDRIAYNSQRSGTMTTAFAPGAFITGAKVFGGTVTMSGTSLAAPHVTGMAVLAQGVAQRYLGRSLANAEFTQLLRETGTTINDGDDEDDTVPNTGLDCPRVDMMALAEAIWLLDPPPGSHALTLATGQVAESVDFGSHIAQNVQTSITGDNTRVSETGTMDAFDVMLPEQPQSDVVIQVTVGNSSEVTADKTTLTTHLIAWRTGLC